jgi:hypothetical protein
MMSSDGVLRIACSNPSKSVDFRTPTIICASVPHTYRSFGVSVYTASYTVSAICCGSLPAPAARIFSNAFSNASNRSQYGVFCVNRRAVLMFPRNPVVYAPGSTIATRTPHGCSS